MNETSTCPSNPINKKNENSFAAIILLRRSTVQQRQNMPMEPNQLVALPRLKGVSLTSFQYFATKTPAIILENSMTCWPTNKYLYVQPRCFSVPKCHRPECPSEGSTKALKSNEGTSKVLQRKQGGLGKTGLGNFMLNSRFQNWDSVCFLDPGYR